MFATIVSDIYTIQDREEVAQAIDDLCSPHNLLGWASAGVYGIWDPFTKEQLYLGYTSDFHQRFSQHNGLIECKPGACKWKQIQKYFTQKPRIGVSLLMTEPQEQSFVKRHYEKWLQDRNPEIFKKYKGKSRGAAATLEGAFLKAFEIEKERLPEWNRKGGSKVGQAKARVDHSEIAGWLLGDASILSSRFSLRQLSRSALAEGLENDLHGARIQVLNDAFLTGNNPTMERLREHLVATTGNPKRLELFDRFKYSTRQAIEDREQV